MRIAIHTASDRQRGGAETYIAGILDDLGALGCEVALIHEGQEPRGAAAIELPAGAPSWNVGHLGRETVLADLRDWGPTIVFGQGGQDLELEAALIGLAPAVLFAHNYYGVCVSGTKLVRFPVARPCERTLGVACLAHYFPRRCGGLNPATMVRRFAFERRRLELLRRYRAIVTGSHHMRDEYLRHGLPADQVHVIPFSGSPVHGDIDGSGAHPSSSASRPTAAPEAARRLLFVGRMEDLKGGSLLVRALPLVARAIGRPVHLTLVGSGRAEARWREDAARASLTDPRVQTEFTGWLAEGELGLRLTAADLLVVPSIWPEPFGLVGLEAAAHGVPAVAFDVGGIPEWLVHGVSGILAPGAPATTTGLADAIAAAIGDDATLARLRAGAREVARRFAEHRHAERLLSLFTLIAERRPGLDVACV